MKKILACSLACLGALAVFATETPARAADFKPAFMTSRAGGYIDIWPAKDVVGLWFGADLQFRLTPHVFLDATFGGSYLDLDLGGRRYNHAAYGNPTIGVHYADEITRKVSFYAGGALTFPFLHDPDNEVTFVAGFSSPMRGFYDYDRLAVGRMAVRGAFGIEAQLAQRFYLRAEAKPVFSILTHRVNTIFGTADDFLFFLEHAAEGEYRLDNGLGFGLRLQGVFMPQFDDLYQTVAEPFLMLTPRSRGLYLRLGFPIALDKDLGFGFDDNKLATIRFQIGGQW